MTRLVIAAFVAATTTLWAQQPAPVQPIPPPEQPDTTLAAVQKLGPTTYRLGEVRVDTALREVSVSGTVNDVQVLEFVANTKGGAKAYESALTLNTNAVTFNAALLLIGLDPGRGRPPKMQFDPTPPEGDPVDVHVQWSVNGKNRRAKVEELLYDQRTKKTLPTGPWAYTGSTFIDFGDGSGKHFLAELDGVLIGFMHGPQALIDNPRNDAVNGFGALVFNPTLGLAAATPVTLVVKALNR